jgi:hypothetical protein
MIGFGMAQRGETKRSYRDELAETLREGVPDWAKELLAKLK